MDSEILKLMRKAVKSGDINLVKEMIKKYEGLKDELTGFGTWLHVAAKHGQLELVKYFVEIGININQNGDFAKCGAIRSAASEGHLNIVRYLYENGAQFDVSSFNKNPLFGAIIDGHFEVVKFFVENGIDITVGYNIGSLENADACEYARQYGQTEIVNYLKDKLQQK